jgi:hypothetical protein
MGTTNGIDLPGIILTDIGYIFGDHEINSVFLRLGTGK